jgi:Protein of unknown function (DUF3048) N-terminal domain/Protein of unknown function (DUF3048) C-terminal domain
LTRPRRPRPSPPASLFGVRLSRRLAIGCCALLLASACSAPWARQPAGHPHGPRFLPAPGLWTLFLLDGQPVTGAVRATRGSHLQLLFDAPQHPEAVGLVVDGAPAAPDVLVWHADHAGADVSLDRLAPYHPATFDVRANVPVHSLGPVQVTVAATVPANGSTGVEPGFRPATPLEVVVENSPPARPQAGLQDADIVYEYLSEYSVTRMTAIYFKRMPPLVGPVRSCRMVNPYLAYAYGGFVMCSGVSDGTAHYLFGAGPDARPVAALLEGAGSGQHFLRSPGRAAPHNVYTSSDRAEPIRAEQPQPPGDYVVEPPHDGTQAGQPADAPAVPQHSVAYAYDGGSHQYLRSDHGTPFVDEVTGGQVHARTVVLLHVPFHDAGWIEDENGGAHSIWYDLLGSGPAELYADGTVVHATWHMGAPGQAYYDNHTPVWFTDESGKVVQLGTGLTWIHVLGNGQ